MRDRAGNNEGKRPRVHVARCGYCGVLPGRDHLRGCPARPYARQRPQPRRRYEDACMTRVVSTLQLVETASVLGALLGCVGVLGLSLARLDLAYAIMVVAIGLTLTMCWLVAHDIDVRVRAPVTVALCALTWASVLPYFGP